MKKVLVVIADYAYLNHAKYLFSSALNDGYWDGEFCLIANNIDHKDLSDFKCEIIHISNSNYFYAKYFIFHTCMKKWDYLLYMDCDFSILGDINKLAEDHVMNSPLLSVDIEPFRIYEYFCQGWDRELKKEKMAEICHEYDLNKFGFNAGLIGFNTSIIKENTLDDLFELSHKLQEINNHAIPGGSDQPILNIHFNDMVAPIKNKKVSYWKHSDENTVAQHHCHWDAPWKNNVFSQRLNETYNQRYLKNLGKFNDSFN